ncbi:MAG: hypothetical protein PHW96_04405 [Candidatus Nanoarchaeia archaeon]|nr:hypothetical protein [Candidatus Nanoarchaeia archaeon]
MKKGDLNFETLVKLLIAILVGVGVIVLIIVFGPRLSESAASFFQSMRL